MTRSPLPFVAAAPTARHALPFERRVHLHASPPTPPGRWLVLCDRGGLGESVAEALRDRGDEVIRVARLDPARPMHRQTPAEVVLGPDGADAFAELIEVLDTPDRPLRGVVHLWGLDDPHLDAGPPLQTMARETGLMTVTAALEQAGATPRLWIVTRGALPAEAGRPDARQTLMWSFGQVLGVAQPQLRPTLVELDPARPPREGAAALARALGSAPNHRRLVTRRRCWYAPARLDLAAIDREARAA